MIDNLITDVIRREGRAYENVPDDSGGPTKFGITLDRLRLERKNPRLTWIDVRNLTEAEARSIYRDAYFQRPRLFLLPDALIPSAFDWYVNSGAHAIRGLQRVLREAGWAVEIDGEVGPQTARCAHEAWRSMGNYLINAYVDERQRWYTELVQRRPKDMKFWAGWLSRAADFRVPA